MGGACLDQDMITGSAKDTGNILFGGGDGCFSGRRHFAGIAPRTDRWRIDKLEEKCGPNVDISTF